MPNSVEPTSNSNYSEKIKKDKLTPESIENLTENLMYLWLAIDPDCRIHHNDGEGYHIENSKFTTQTNSL